MDREVKFTSILKPVCMPTRGKSFSHLDVCIYDEQIRIVIDQNEI